MKSMSRKTCFISAEITIKTNHDCFQEHLSADTIAMVTDLGAGIGFALYPAQLSDENGFPADFPGRVRSAKRKT